MSKKDFGNLAGRIRSVAETQPGVRPPAALSVVPAAAPAAPPEATAAPPLAPPQAAPQAAPAAEDDTPIQQAFNIRPTLRRELHRRAAESGKSITGFVMLALRDKGLPVTDADIEDRRKRRR